MEEGALTEGERILVLSSPCTATRGKMLLEQLSKSRFLNPVKNRGFESYSNISFPLVQFVCSTISMCLIFIDF